MDALYIFESSDLMHLTLPQHHHRSTLRPPLKTYSKRVLKDFCPPAKRQRVGAAKFEQPPLECQIETPVKAVLKKRAISDYFRVAPKLLSPRAHSTSDLSFDPPEEDIATPPSSPPPVQNCPSVAPRNFRTKRRLTTRPALSISMNSFNQQNKRGKDSRKGSSPPFHPNSRPRRKSFLGKDSIPGLRKAADGGTSSEEDQSNSSEEVNHPGAITIPNTRRTLIDIPFSPPRHITYTMSSQASAPSADDSGGASTSDSMVAVLSNLTVSNEDHQGTGSGSNLVSLTSGGTASGEVVNPQTPAEHQDSEYDDGGRSNIPAHSSAASASIEPIIEPTVSDSAHQGLQGATGHVLFPFEAPTQLHPTNAQARRPAPMIQSSINMGSPDITHCGTCNIPFNRAIASDVRYHDVHHSQFVFGIGRGSLQPGPTQQLHNIWSRCGPHGQDYIVSVDRRSSAGWKELTELVLEMHVDGELGCAPIESAQLWSTLSGSTTNPTEVGRFTVYLYMTNISPDRQDRVVGLLLVERVNRACGIRSIQALEDEFGDWPSIVPQMEEEIADPIPAHMGVNKIWVLPIRRLGGRARLLLDTARRNFLFGVDIRSTEIAWTYPTADGKRLATSYTDSDDFLYLYYADYI